MAYNTEIQRIHEAHPLQQLAAAVIQRALLDATGQPPKVRLTWRSQNDAIEFLQSDRVLPWLELVVPEDVDPDHIVTRLREAA